ncbi:tol-pal system protein YbgF [Rhodobacteraceae bacterium KN286]|uniref:Cell division coordinator CpoB n=2 Tax=Oceanomicrobium pacificus TaxID=2692916 RepID=A0A6B0TUQ7_9RHOB|nr:tol-pal system protein YbgF [Oceanomicrobium pacificus]
MVLPVKVQAQSADAQTLADIRAELTDLYNQIGSLRRELVQNPGPAAGTDGGTVNTGPALQRLDVLEADLRQINGRVEELQNRITQIVEDGTNRIGDLEFRLVELEGGDTSLLGDTPTLGGDAVTATPLAPVDGQGGTVASGGIVENSTGGTAGGQAGGEAVAMAVGEQAEFDRARAAYEAGDYAQAAELFSRFSETYPGGPLSVEAQFLKAEALSAAGDWANAARAYLGIVSGGPSGDYAPMSMYKLGVSLARLGRRDEACLTFDEVQNRYPGAPSQVLSDTLLQKQNLGCR